MEQLEYKLELLTEKQEQHDEKDLEKNKEIKLLRQEIKSFKLDLDTNMLDL
jgi:hypothetical protein